MFLSPHPMTAPPRRRQKSASPLPRLAITRRTEDTAAGCYGLAATSLAKSAAMDTANGRLRMEASSAQWHARAELLERLEGAENARRAKMEAAAALSATVQEAGR